MARRRGMGLAVRIGAATTPVTARCNGAPGLRRRPNVSFSAWWRSPSGGSFLYQGLPALQLGEHLCRAGTTFEIPCCQEVSSHAFGVRCRERIGDIFVVSAIELRIKWKLGRNPTFEVTGGLEMRKKRLA